MRNINFIWFNYFRPNLFVKSINDINVSALKRSGIKYIICDLDNTLVPHFTKVPNKFVTQFFEALAKNDIKVIVVSNNSKKRVENFCSLVDVFDFVYTAKKPLLFKTKNILKKYNISYNDAIVIGDQIITDIWLANRLKIKSILVLPIFNTTDDHNLFMNFIEKLIYTKLQHANLLTEFYSKGIKESYDTI